MKVVRPIKPSLSVDKVFGFGFAITPESRYNYTLNKDTYYLCCSIVFICFVVTLYSFGIKFKN